MNQPITKGPSFFPESSHAATDENYRSIFKSINRWKTRSYLNVTLFGGLCEQAMLSVTPEEI
ncbi:MAG: hypothetical protein L0387_17385 [Acidobacteria bacterium]|nr:hypothetical protein [Acidobacteriota bacterium]MCI0722707.1 hypothetical protein [Acidobacteriota bacterium]